MLPRDRAEKILTLGKAGWSVRAIADQLGHSEPTIRGYLSGRTTPGVRAPRPSLLTDPLAGYCRQRFAEDPHLRPSTLFKELTELGFQASRSTFYRELTQGRLTPPGHRPSPAQADPPQILAGVSRTPGHAPVLPRPVTPVTGEALISYLTRLAHASHLTLTEVWRASHFPDCGSFRILSWKGPELPGKIKNYSPEFRDEAARLVVETSRAIADVARELGISETSLGNWVRAYREKHAEDEPPLQVSERARLRELERQNRELEMENTFLKKAAAYFAREHR